MPGSICVSVLEAFDLPEAIADGEDVVIKVAVGAREFQTEPNKAYDGKTTPWGLDFVFPVLNLRDNLSVMLLTESGERISRNEIDTPSIVEKGSFDVNLFLDGGGYVHLSLTFVLTEEERRRIDIMRAAALKRREQQALKISNPEYAEKAKDNTSSDSQSAAAGDNEKDIEESGIVNVSPPTAPQLNKSEGILQGTCGETSGGLGPVGDLDPTNQETTQQNSTGTSDESTTPHDSVEAGQSAAEPINLKTSGTNELPSQLCTLSKLEEHTGSEAQEVINVNPSPNSVKAKIKAFETTRPKGGIKQGHILPGNVEVHVSNPQFKSSLNIMEHEADQAVPKEHVDCTGARRAVDEKHDSANRMETVEPFTSFSGSNVAASRASEADICQTKKECLHEREGKGAENSLEPLVNTDHAEHSESIVQREETLGRSSKQRRRNFDIMDVSKQMLTGAIVGAVSGALLIAAGALLWAPNKRRNKNVRQRHTQEKTKYTTYANP